MIDKLNMSIGEPKVCSTAVMQMINKSLSLKTKKTKNSVINTNVKRSRVRKLKK